MPSLPTRSRCWTTRAPAPAGEGVPAPRAAHLQSPTRMGVMPNQSHLTREAPLCALDTTLSLLASSSLVQGRRLIFFLAPVLVELKGKEINLESSKKTQITLF